MKRVTFLLVLLSLGLLFVACGGSSGETEPASVDNESTQETTSTEETEEEPIAEEVSSEEEEATNESEEMEEEASSEEEATDESEEMEEESAEEASTEEEAAPASGYGDLPLSGTDPDTGLTINPASISPGESILIRGEIISMNLTPTTSPEFLIQLEDGTKYRFRSQDLAETYFLDGSQIKAFEYRIGMLGQAVITLASDAGPSDLATSENLTLISMGE